MRMPKAAASCWRRAAEVETQAAQITDEHLKAVYLRIARQWSGLARSYEFADSAKRFLLDAKWTKDANARQPKRELVLLPSSLPSGEAKHFLPPVPAMPAGQLGPPAAFSTGQRAGVEVMRFTTSRWTSASNPFSPTFWRLRAKMRTRFGRAFA
jgi:hypothetical protein